MKATKSIWARIMVLCLTVAMVLSVATVGAFAAPIDEVDQTGTVTVIGSVNDAEAAVTLYKIINVNMDEVALQPKDPMYKWVDAVAAWLKTNETYKSYINETTNAVTDTFATLPAGELSNFYAALAGAIKDKTITITNTEEEQNIYTGEVGKNTYSCTLTVAMGQYLVVAEKSSYVYSPATVTLAPVWDEGSKAWVLNDASVTVKGKGGIEKTVTGGDLQYAVGDTVNYRLDVVIPTYPVGATATAFNVGDKMGAGLTWSGAVSVYWSSNGELDTGNTVDASYYTLVPNAEIGQSGEKATFEIKFEYKDLVAEYTSAKYIHVVYTAILNEDAFTTDSLGNDAYLGVNTDPYDGGSYETTDTHEQVYTYGIDVTKVDANNHATTLAGAEFTLKNADGTEIQFVKTGDGVYVKYAAANYEPGEDITPVTTLVTGTNGTLQLKGLDIGIYTLTETKAPGGYQLPNDKNAVTTIVMNDNKIGTGTDVQDGQDGILDEDTTTVSGSMLVESSTDYADNVVIFQLGNTKPGFELPTTGGMGTVAFTAGGLIIMACGAALVLVTLKKKKAED